jgi:hypothetical protein
MLTHGRGSGFVRVSPEFSPSRSVSIPLPHTDILSPALIPLSISHSPYFTKNQKMKGEESRRGKKEQRRKRREIRKKEGK